jgi:hypothetical protein
VCKNHSQTHQRHLATATRYGSRHSSNVVEVASYSSINSNSNSNGNSNGNGTQACPRWGPKGSCCVCTPTQPCLFDVTRGKSSV